MKIKTAQLALIISILALIVSLFTAVQVSQNDNAALIDALMVQNQDLQAQIDALSGNRPADGASLSAAAWADGLGADVTLVLEDAPDTDALLRVMQGDAVITEVPCRWDGAALTATASIAAGNGYTYSLILGSEARVLASPEEPVYPKLVYLADALSAYCNLVVGPWHLKDDILTLETCHAAIQAPQLCAGSIPTCADARLVLKSGDRILADTPITPVPGEEPGSYVCNLVDAAFTLPELNQGEQLDLWLEATLSDGQLLTASTATWYVMPNGFSMAAG